MSRFLTRREFLRSTASIAGSMSAFHLMRPSCLMADTPNNPNGTIKYLILLVLDGGYDGHTLFPFTDARQDLMQVRRPTLGVPRSDVLTLGSGLGLNPLLSSFHSTHQSGQLKLLAGVGRQNASRSHEDEQTYYSLGGRNLPVAQRVGHLARLASTYGLEVNQLWGLLYSNTRADFGSHNGYVGLQLGNSISSFNYQNRTSAWGGSTVEGDLTRTIVTQLRNLRSNQSPLEERFDVALNRLDANVPVIQTVAARTPGSNYPPTSTPPGQPADPDQAAFSANQRVINAFMDADRVITDRILTGNTTPVIIQISWGGFDNHGEQQDILDNKMITLNRILSAFRSQMQTLGVWNQTAIYGYSEFNRTLSENGPLDANGAGTGGGTDHSGANIHFLVGGRVNGGTNVIHGAVPEMPYLDARRPNRRPDQSAWLYDNIPYATDYRAVLTQLIDAMGFDGRLIYPETFPNPGLALFT